MERFEAPITVPPPLLDEEDESGSDDSEDEEYIPEKKVRRTIRKKKRKKPKTPDLRGMSLPKARARLDPTVDLGLTGGEASAYFEDLELSSLKCPTPPATSQLASARVSLLQRALRPTRGKEEEASIAAYRAAYAKQLPGMSFYYDAHHLTLANDGVTLGGATFRLQGLASSTGSVLILDVLAVAVDPDRAQRGVGSTLLGVIKAIALREAAAHRAQRPLLLTQAGLGCVPFWEKNGYARALDANTLVRTLRRVDGHTTFDGAVPMGLVLPPPKPAKASLSDKKRKSLGV